MGVSQCCNCKCVGSSPLHVIYAKQKRGVMQDSYIMDANLNDIIVINTHMGLSCLALANNSDITEP